jgi:transcriptional regulator with XRE-family HTH domain
MDIKEIIKSKGFTLSEVAAKMKDKQGNIGVSHASLSQMLSNNPTTNKLREVASIIGCKVGDFFADEMSGTDFTALVKSGNEFFCASSLKELEDIISELKAKS